MNQDETYITRPSLPPLEDFLPYLKEIWQSKWLTNNGEFHKEFEKELVGHLNVENCNLFTNGTIALVTALQALRIRGEVITTPYSFPATTHALHWNGIKPVFCDIKQDDFTIDPEQIESAITPKTTAILPVHVYGMPSEVEKIQEIADIYGLKVIYDAAPAFDVQINGNSILDYGDLSILSFHATKVFTTFEGGAIISDDDILKKRIDYLKNFGFASETKIVAPGINGKMNEFQASLGLLQLKYIKENIQARRNIANHYFKHLSDVQGIELISLKDNIDYNFSYFPILVDKLEYGKTRDELYKLFKEYDIHTRRYYYPLISNFPTYRNLESADKSNLPVAEKISNKVLCLPIYPELSEEELDRIIDIMKDNQGDK